MVAMEVLWTRQAAHLQGSLAHHTAHRTALGRFSMIQSTAGDGSTSRPVETVWFIHVRFVRFYF